MVTWAKRTWRELAAEMFDKDGINTVFLHARNLLTGAAVMAAGLYSMHHLEDKHLAGMWTVHLAGYGVTGLGSGLLALNLGDGLRRLARREVSLGARILLIAAYVGISLRLVQVLLYFRYVS
jgi:hypothetical protein